MSEQKPKDGDLQVWWIPQVPGTPFIVPVNTIAEGVRLQQTLARYDEFQLEHNIKPDYCNVGGLQRYDEQLAKEDEGGNGWCDIDNDECLRIIEASLNPTSGVGPDGEGWDFNLGEPKQSR